MAQHFSAGLGVITEPEARETGDRDSGSSVGSIVRFTDFVSKVNSHPGDKSLGYFRIVRCADSIRTMPLVISRSLFVQLFR